jgi:hypothetical protein
VKPGNVTVTRLNGIKVKPVKVMYLMIFIDCVSMAAIQVMYARLNV